MPRCMGTLSMEEPAMRLARSCGGAVVVGVTLLLCQSGAAHTQSADTGAGIGASAGAGAGAARAEQPKFQTPEETAQAFIAASSAKQWTKALRCFAPESRDLVLTHLITMLQFGAMRDTAKSKSLDELLRTHGFDFEKANAAFANMAKTAKAEGKTPDWRHAVKTFVSSIENKEACSASLLQWADTNFSSDAERKAPAITIKEMKIDGDSAHATLAAGATESSKVHFRKVDGNWFLTLPDRFFEPSGWNDVFVFGYLDAIHHWRF